MAKSANSAILPIHQILAFSELYNKVPNLILDRILSLKDFGELQLRHAIKMSYWDVKVNISVTFGATVFSTYEI